VIYKDFDLRRVASFTTTEMPRRDPGDGRLEKPSYGRRIPTASKDYPTFIQTARRLSTRGATFVFWLSGVGRPCRQGKELAAGVDAITFLREQKNVEPIVAAFDIACSRHSPKGSRTHHRSTWPFRKAVWRPMEAAPAS